MSHCHFFNFGIFNQVLSLLKLTYLVTLLLLASLTMLNETFSVIFKLSEYVILPLSYTTCMYSHPIEYGTYWPHYQLEWMEKTQKKLFPINFDFLFRTFWCGTWGFHAEIFRRSTQSYSTTARRSLFKGMPSGEFHRILRLCFNETQCYPGILYSQNFLATFHASWKF